MKLLRLLCAGMLVVGMQLDASEKLEDAASSTSSEAESLSQQSDVSELSSIPDAPPLFEASELSSQAKQPSSRLQPPPARTPDLSAYVDYLTTVKQRDILALENSEEDFFDDYHNLEHALKLKKQELKRYKKSEQAEALIKEIDGLLAQLAIIHKEREEENNCGKKQTAKLLHSRHKSSFSPEGSQEPVSVFGWILGVGTVAAIAAIIWYFCYKKPVLAAAH